MSQLSREVQSDPLSMLREVGERLRNPQHVKEVVLDSHNVNPDPLYEKHPPLWNDLTLAAGYPAVILPLVQLDRLFPNERWDDVVHAYVIALKDCLENSNVALSSSIFSGLTGVCFAVQEASREGTRYQKLMASLNEILSDRLKKYYIDPFSDLLKKGQWPSPQFHEVIQGLSGIGLYLLRNLHYPLFFNISQQIVSLMVALMRPKMLDHVQIPGWYVLPEYFLDPQYRVSSPNGNFNLGLSHGMPGVVAYLSVALEHQVVVEGQIEAIQIGVEWIKKHRRNYKDRFSWPSSVSLEEEIEGERRGSDFVRDAWCYGTPGVARSLYLAGSALEDESLKQYALESYQSIFLSAPEEWNITSPTLCHGIGGLLMITDVMAKESSSLSLFEQVGRLKKMVIEEYNSDYPFGFVDLEPMKKGGFAKLNKAGLLEGAVGVLLTLLTADNIGTSSWRLPFLVCKP